MSIASTVILADTWGMHGDIGAGWWIVMMVGMVVFWAAVILGIVWFARGSLDGSRQERRETPMEILERRFAEGGISADEYHERREAITSGSRMHRNAPTEPATK